jgi:hypothetical protein
MTDKKPNVVGYIITPIIVLICFYIIFKVQLEEGGIL